MQLTSLLHSHFFFVLSYNDMKNSCEADQLTSLQNTITSAKKRAPVRLLLSSMAVLQFCEFMASCRAYHTFISQYYSSSTNYCTFASVHFPGFCVFSFFITGSVGGICHSPVDGGRELAASG